MRHTLDESISHLLVARPSGPMLLHHSMTRTCTLTSLMVARVRERCMYAGAAKFWTAPYDDFECASPTFRFERKQQTKSARLNVLDRSERQTVPFEANGLDYSSCLKRPYLYGSSRQKRWFLRYLFFKTGIRPHKHLLYTIINNSFSPFLFSYFHILGHWYSWT